MDRLRRHVPISRRFKLGVDEDVFINLGLQSTNESLVEYDRDNVINVDDVFNRERIGSRCYRFSGRLNVITANELTPDALNEDWDFLFDGNPSLMPNNWLLQITYPVESDGDFGITSRTTGGTITTIAEKGPQILDMVPAVINGQEPKTGVVGIQKHNLSVGDSIYIYSNNTTSQYQGIHTVKSLGINGGNEDVNFVIDKPYDGNSSGNYKKVLRPTLNDIIYNNSLDIITITSTDLSGTTTGSFQPNETIYTRITTLDPHSVSVGEYVDLRGNLILNGLYEAKYVVDDYNFIVKLTVSTVKGQQTNYAIPRPKMRIMDGTPSEYYIRYFEVLTTNKYETYRAGFSTSIYPKTIVNEFGKANDTWLYHFNKDINTIDLVDNRGGEVTDVYLGIIKRAGENTYNWSNVVSDWEFNRTDTTTLNGIELISNNVVGSVGTIEKSDVGDRYVGDYVEYNRLELKEKVISETIHRFAPNTTPNGEGYYYKPFRNLKLRVYSNAIEKADPDEEIIGLPTNYETYPNGERAWRDLLDIGVFEPENEDRVNYPFVNGCHYYYKSHYLFIRRQVPVDEIDQSDVITIEPIEDC